MRRLDIVLSDLIARRRTNGPDHVISSLRRRLAGEPEVVVLSGRTDMAATGQPAWKRGLLIASGVALVVLAIAVPVLWLGNGDRGEAAGTSGETAAVTFSARRFGGQPVTSVILVSGDAVDRGMICPQIFEYSSPRYESPAGDEIDPSDWAVTYFAAVDAGMVSEVTQYHTWICADGTGTLKATYEFRLDTSEEWNGRLEAGTWSISGGTDAYSEARGSGHAVVDFDTSGYGGWIFSGEIATG